MKRIEDSISACKSQQKASPLGKKTWQLELLKLRKEQRLSLSDTQNRLNLLPLSPIYYRDRSQDYIYSLALPVCAGTVGADLSYRKMTKRQMLRALKNKHYSAYSEERKHLIREISNTPYTTLVHTVVGLFK